MGEMSHPHDGDLRALLDDELDRGEAERIRQHLSGCSSCRARRDELRGAEETVRRALAGTGPTVDLESARRSVERRLEEAEPRKASRGPRPALARAAAVALVLLGGAAMAVPGSPVRGWLGGLFDSSAAPDPPAVTAPDPAPGTGGDQAGSAEIRLAPASGSVVVELVDAEPGTRVLVVRVDRESGGVTAGTGARFRTAAGRTVVTGASGEVRVEIPRSAAAARVIANGRVLLRKEGTDTDYPSVEPESSGAGTLFIVPPASGG
jgi:hypothetical protein